MGWQFWFWQLSHSIASHFHIAQSIKWPHSQKVWANEILWHPNTNTCDLMIKKMLSNHHRLTYVCMHAQLAVTHTEHRTHPFSLCCCSPILAWWHVLFFHSINKDPRLAFLSISVHLFISMWSVCYFPIHYNILVNLDSCNRIRIECVLYPSQACACANRVKFRLGVAVHVMTAYTLFEWIQEMNGQTQTKKIIEQSIRSQKRQTHTNCWYTVEYCCMAESSKIHTI